MSSIAANFIFFKCLTFTSTDWFESVYLSFHKKKLFNEESSGPFLGEISITPCVSASLKRQDNISPGLPLNLFRNNNQLFEILMMAAFRLGATEPNLHLILNAFQVFPRHSVLLSSVAIFPLIPGILNFHPFQARLSFTSSSRLVRKHA